MLRELLELQDTLHSKTEVQLRFTEGNEGSSLERGLGRAGLGKAGWMIGQGWREVAGGGDLEEERVIWTETTPTRVTGGEYLKIITITRIWDKDN